MPPKVIVGLSLVSVGILAPVRGFVSIFRMLVRTIKEAGAGAGDQVPVLLADEVQRSVMLAFGLLLVGVVVGLIGLRLVLSGLANGGDRQESDDDAGASCQKHFPSGHEHKTSRSLTELESQ